MTKYVLNGGLKRKRVKVSVKIADVQILIVLPARMAIVQGYLMS